MCPHPLEGLARRAKVVVASAVATGAGAGVDELPEPVTDAAMESYRTASELGAGANGKGEGGVGGVGVLGDEAALKLNKGAEGDLVGVVVGDVRGGGAVGGLDIDDEVGAQPKGVGDHDVGALHGRVEAPLLEGRLGAAALTLDAVGAVHLREHGDEEVTHWVVEGVGCPDAAGARGEVQRVGEGLRLAASMAPDLHRGERLEEGGLKTTKQPKQCKPTETAETDQSAETAKTPETTNTPKRPKPTETKSERDRARSSMRVLRVIMRVLGGLT